MMRQALHSKLGELGSALGIGNVQEMFEEWQATGGLSLSGIGGGGGATIDLEAGKQVRTILHCQIDCRMTLGKYL